MSGDINNHKEEVEKLSRLGRLVDKYTQSRSLGLWVSLAVLATHAIVAIGTMELIVVLVLRRSSWWWVPIIFAGLWGLISTVWLLWFDSKHSHRFYDKKDGKIEVERGRAPVWVMVLFVITCLGPIILNACEIMSDRWGLTISLISFALFVLYQCTKEKEKIVGIVLGSLCLLEAAATALGAPIPLTEIPLADTGISAHSFVLALMIYIGAAGLATMVLVHIYNRWILRKIKEVRPFDE